MRKGVRGVKCVKNLYHGSVSYRNRHRAFDEVHAFMPAHRFRQPCGRRVLKQPIYIRFAHTQDQMVHSFVAIGKQCTFSHFGIDGVVSVARKR